MEIKLARYPDETDGTCTVGPELGSLKESSLVRDSDSKMKNNMYLRDPQWLSSDC